MRGRGLTLVLLLILPGVVAVGFSRLLGSPGSILADPSRPSIDYARPDSVRPIGNDLTTVFLPRFVRIVDRVWRHGRLPRWDDSGFGGRPMIGNPQAGMFYPPVWLAYAVGAPAALGWLTVAHLVFAGLGVYGLCRSQGVSRLGSSVAGGCFEVCPYLVAHVCEGHYPHVWTVCWYPWAFWAALRAVEGSVAGVFALPIVLALGFLAGHPQEWYYLVVALSVWWAVLVAGRLRARGLASGAMWLGLWGVVLAMSLAFAAVEVVPVNAAQPWTLVTSVIPLRFISRYHLRGINGFQLLNPFALGGPAEYFGPDNYWETVVSIGVAPLFLGFLGGWRHPDRRVARRWGWLVLLSVVFAVGRSLGLFSIAYAILPGMDRFRVPGRTLFLGSLGACVLVGMGVDVVQRSREFASRWGRIRLELMVAAVVIWLLVVGTGVFPEPARPSGRRLDERGVVFSGEAGRWKDETPVALRSVMAARSILKEPVFSLGLLGMVAILALDARRRWPRVVTASALAALGLFEVSWEARSVLVCARMETFARGAEFGEEVRRNHDPSTGPIRVSTLDSAYSDLRAALDRVEKTNVNDGFQIQTAADFYERLYPYLDPAGARDEVERPMDRPAAVRNDLVARRVLDLMGVRRMILNPRRDGASRGPCAARQRRPRESLNTSALPMAYVVPAVHLIESPPRGRRWVPEGFDPRAAVAMPTDPLPPGPRARFRPARWSGAWEDRDPDRVELHVTTEAPGLLVVANTWMPGWSAVVDGVPAQVLRGNHCQQVVPLVGAGDHRVLLRYEPPGLARGACISAAALLGWGVFGVLAWLRSRRLRPNRAACGATIPASGSP